jgi:hypothetical protein
MSIRDAVAWLFDVGDGSEAEALKQRPASVRPEQSRPHELLERPLYGQAEAIRVLYQSAVYDERPPAPPRPKRGRASWVVRYADALSASLRDPVTAKA